MKEKNMFNAIRIILRFSLIAVILFIISCTSEPKVTEFNNTANSETELDRINSNIQQAELHQVDIISPNNFKAAVQSKKMAIEERSKNKSQISILHRIAVAQAYLDQANKVAKISNEILSDSIRARQEAIDAQSIKYFPDEVSRIDNDFTKLTTSIEKNNTLIKENDQNIIVKKYQDLELKSIKKDKLGRAQNTLQTAKNEGAQKLTPETLVWAEKKYSESEAAIEANRHSPFIIQTAGAVAVNSTDRLLKMVRFAKGSTAMKPEDFAKESERKNSVLNQSKDSLDQTLTELTNSENQVADFSAKNQQLESKLWLDQKYETARKQFDPNEAEVFRQGNKLLLRLKGLSFLNNRAMITPENFPLMAKVQKVIDDITPDKIAIEGHTDSVGEKKSNEILSVKRAQSVQAYIVSNNNISADNISVSGLGDTKPISTNKTETGRAQNRRVDVIITYE